MAKNDSKAIMKALKAACNESLQGTVVAAQAALGDERVSPKDTGRFRSSWTAGTGSPSRWTPPEGADSPCTDAVGLTYKAGRDVYLSSNLEYSQYVVAGDQVVSRPTTWFADFRNFELKKIAESELKAVKQKYDL